MEDNFASLRCSCKCLLEQKTDTGVRKWQAAFRFWASVVLGAQKQLWMMRAIGKETAVAERGQTFLGRLGLSSWAALPVPGAVPASGALPGMFITLEDPPVPDTEASVHSR